MILVAEAPFMRVEPVMLSGPTAGRIRSAPAEPSAATTACTLRSQPSMRTARARAGGLKPSSTGVNTAGC